jgi:hypothetical protein
MDLVRRLCKMRDYQNRTEEIKKAHAAKSCGVAAICETLLPATNTPHSG